MLTKTLNLFWRNKRMRVEMAEMVITFAIAVVYIFYDL